MKIRKELVFIILITLLLIAGLAACTSFPEITISKEMTALELSVLMGNGTNLANTMEAYGHLDPGINEAPQVYETLWGQPVTTKAMLAGMKKAGFDSIRIPVAWTNTMNYENDDFTISPAYLDRVEEIVNYALDAEMIVVINDHWDGSWWGMFGSATPATREKGMKLYKAMWSQIANRFQNYSYKVIFESANEELGDRLNDVNVAKDSGALSEDECYETTNLINQTFVDIIRNAGGYNSDRFLLIAGYNTDITRTCDDRFIMPEDTVPHKLLVSVHYYTPWSYAGTPSISRWGSTKEVSAMNDLLVKMTKFTKEGYGVIFGEHGPLPLLDDGSFKDNLSDYLNNFLDNCDLYNYVPMLWDASDYFIRKKARIADSEIANLYRQRSFTAQSSMTQDEIKKQAAESIQAALEKSRDYKEIKPALDGEGNAVAWIMYSSNDWSITYSVGDQYDPNNITNGVVATDVLINGAGTYTVGLDFTGTGSGYASSVAFSALGISNGELLFPGYIITIKDILINGKPYKLNGVPYTTTDNKICTRLNLFNGWVNDTPPEARTADGDLSNLSATVLDKDTLGDVETIYITFDYGPVE